MLSRWPRKGTTAVGAYDYGATNLDRCEMIEPQAAYRLGVTGSAFVRFKKKRNYCSTYRGKVVDRSQFTIHGESRGFVVPGWRLNNLRSLVG
jgi:hypothetical protein